MGHGIGPAQRRCQCPGDACSGGPGYGDGALLKRHTGDRDLTRPGKGMRRSDESRCAAALRRPGSGSGCAEQTALHPTGPPSPGRPYPRQGPPRLRPGRPLIPPNTQSGPHLPCVLQVCLLFPGTAPPPSPPNTKRSKGCPCCCIFRAYCICHSRERRAYVTVGKGGLIVDVTVGKGPLPSSLLNNPCAAFDALGPRLSPQPSRTWVLAYTGSLHTQVLAVLTPLGPGGLTTAGYSPPSVNPEHKRTPRPRARVEAGQEDPSAESQG